MQLDNQLEGKLVSLATALVDQGSAAVAVAPLAAKSGFWFGGGNLIECRGKFYLVGRYRNAGDSRTGVRAGERGLELAIWRSSDAIEFEKIVSLPKSKLGVGDRAVLSIEGSALNVTEDGRIELFVSSEKGNLGYPAEVADYLKPGTGVWTIDRMVAGCVEDLGDAIPETLVECGDPLFIHCKDPNVCRLENGDTLLTFCTHPFCWSSSNTSFAVRRRGAEAFEAPRHGAMSRGIAWDVAMTRVTCVAQVPATGCFDGMNVKLLFYDGGESLRDLDAHQESVKRPRGYSCEELGGVAYMVDDDLENIVRLSRLKPLFVSPHGTGCSRYVSVLSNGDELIATWQRSQPDRSQPLFRHSLKRPEVERILRP